ncbi:HPr(Ser) kinase/phosphatase [Mycoplasmopsis pullorum]|uniref:HPr(Ser) kinase/phosphatase n=1 Tax=Mycoplasmopsis pullorum TaxID=48003 RepID=UPI001118F055|nr:HPr(Ser) kinase/phosphatase [Mycoplasmopsis pullorum]TNK85816.1 HPr kinase/phosphorylase [Mycoplasmopsis pullorum]
MNKRKISSTEIIEKFSLNIVNADNNPNYWNIYSPAIKRVGLELTRSIKNERVGRNIISWGTSESKWFNSIGKKKTIDALNAVFQYHPPLVILSKGVSERVQKWIVQAANEHKIPVAVSEDSTSLITTTIGTYLNDFYTQETQVHGCLVLIGGVGVLIVGPSGLGKSEATLDLIQRGHVFISDDAVLIKYSGGRFVGRSPLITKNFLEVRGIGIIDVKYTYGINAIASNCTINLVVELVQKQNQHELDRLGIHFLEYPILKGSIKKMQIPVKDGGNTASLIEAAVSAYLARHDGNSILEEMEKRRRDNEYY